MTDSLVIEWVNINSLTPNESNPRLHSDDQVAQIAESMRAFGWTVPILVDEKGLVIAGHGRLMAAKLNKVDRVPILRKAGLSDAQKRAYMLADNKLALGSEWDTELLVAELGALDALDFDLDLTGFSDVEISALTFEPDFQPGGIEDQGALDQLAPKMITCPHCGGSFDVREHG